MNQSPHLEGRLVGLAPLLLELVPPRVVHHHGLLLDGDQRLDGVKVHAHGVLLDGESEGERFFSLN